MTTPSELVERLDALPRYSVSGSNFEMDRARYGTYLRFDDVLGLLAAAPPLFAETVSCEHVSEKDFVVVRLHMCHDCIARVKACYVAAPPREQDTALREIYEYIKMNRDDPDCTPEDFAAHESDLTIVLNVARRVAHIELDAALGAGEKGTDGPFLASDCNSDTASDSRTYRIGADPSQARRAEIAAHPHNAGEPSALVADITKWIGADENDDGLLSDDFKEARNLLQRARDEIVAADKARKLWAANTDADDLEIEHLHGRIDALEASRRELWEQLAKRDVSLANLRAELAEARKDAERYRWLRSQHGIVQPEAAVTFNFGNGWMNVADGIALDKAIDAARGEHER